MEARSNTSAPLPDRDEVITDYLLRQGLSPFPRGEAVVEGANLPPLLHDGGHSGGLLKVPPLLLSDPGILAHTQHLRGGTGTTNNLRTFCKRQRGNHNTLAGSSPDRLGVIVSVPGRFAASV